MFNKNQKGAIDLVFVAALIAVVIFAVFVSWTIKNSNETVPIEDPVLTQKEKEDEEVVPTREFEIPKSLSDYLAKEVERNIASCNNQGIEVTTTPVREVHDLIDGTYASINAVGCTEDSAAYQILVLRGEKWEYVDGGQATPYCFKLKEYNVPSDLIVRNSYVDLCTDKNNVVIEYTN